MDQRLNFMKLKKKNIILLFCALGTGVLVLYFIHQTSINQTFNANYDEAIEKIYSNYQYMNKSTVYIGTQPLYAVTGLISEKMQRDPILKEELNKLGLKVKFYPFLKGFDVNKQLFAGNIQCGIGGDMPTLIAAEKTDIVITARLHSGKTWFVTRAPLRLQELRGKRIAYAHGSNAHFMLLDLIVSYGFTEEDFILVPMEINQMIPALKNQYISGFAAWEHDIFNFPWEIPLRIPEKELEKQSNLKHEYEFLKKMGSLPEDSSWQKIQQSFNLKIIPEILSQPEKYKLSGYLNQK